MPAWWASILWKRVLRLPVEVDVASEFRYRDPLLCEKTLVIVISQSGETADTLAALRLARVKGHQVLAITNVVGSSVAREADKVLLPGRPGDCSCFYQEPILHSFFPFTCLPSTWPKSGAFWNRSAWKIGKPFWPPGPGGKYF